MHNYFTCSRNGENRGNVVGGGRQSREVEKDIDSLVAMGILDLTGPSDPIGKEEVNADLTIELSLPPVVALTLESTTYVHSWTILLPL